MSNAVNDTVLDKAYELINECEGMGSLSDAMRRDISANDLEGLFEHMKIARKLLDESEALDV